MANNNLPYNLEAEKYIISIALIDSSKAKYIVNELTLDDFYDEKYKAIYEAIFTLNKLNKNITFNSIINTLEELGYLKKLGGSNFLNDLMNEFIEDKSFEDTLKLLEDKKVARNIIKKIRELDDKYSKNLYENDEQFINLAENEISDIARTKKVDNLSSTSDIAESVSKQVEIIRNSPTGLVGFDTGFEDINKFTSGMQKGQVTVIAARPGVGKSALGLNICYNVASRSSRPVLVFSVEMGDIEIGQRILSSISNVPSEKIASGDLSNDDLAKLNKAYEVFKKVPLYSKYCNGGNIGDIINTCTKFKEQHGDLAMVMVDYIGLIGTGQKEESTRIQIGKVSHALKKLAMDLEIPVIAISQVRRTDQVRPAMTDLKESGDIEADADRIFLLYRDDYEGNANGKTNKSKFDQSSKNEGSETSSDANVKAGANKIAQRIDPGTSIVEVNIAKNRNGKTGVAVLLFFKALQKFASASKEVLDDYNLAKRKQEERD